MANIDVGQVISSLSVAAPLVIQIAQALFKKPMAAASIPAPAPLDQDALNKAKKDTVMQALMLFLNQGISSGVIPKPTEPINEQAISGMVETVFQQMKASGQLDAPASALPAMLGQLYILQGTVTPLVTK